MKRILTFVFLSMLTVTMVYGQGMSDTQGTSIHYEGEEGWHSG